MDQLLFGSSHLRIRLGSSTKFQLALMGLHEVKSRQVNVIVLVSRIKMAVNMLPVHILPRWRRRSIHAMLILVKATLQISKIPVIKLYFTIETSLVGGIESMWWPYPSDMILQLRPKLMHAQSY